jgi:hypothetical protein
MISRLASLLFAFCFLLLRSEAATLIDTNCSQVYPAVAAFSQVVNVRPGDGQTVTVNPPAFSWFYSTNYLDTPHYWTIDLSDAAADYAARKFQFQVAYNTNFTNCVLDQTAYWNWSAFHAPFTNGTSPIYWRVAYMNYAGTVTNRWSPTYTFYVATNSGSWDRSFMTNESWITSRAAHPHVLFNGTNNGSISNWLSANNPLGLGTIFSTADTATNAAWWITPSAWATNATADPNYAIIAQADVSTRCNGIGSVAFLRQLGVAPYTTYTNLLIANLSNLVAWFTHPSNNYAYTDPGMVGGGEIFLQTISASYDWLYDVLPTVTASNTLLAMVNANRVTYKNWFWTDQVSGNLNKRDGFVYNPPFYVPWSIQSRSGTSHESRWVSTASYAALAGFGDDTELREYFDLILQYWICRGIPYGGFAAHNFTRGYTLNHIGQGGFYEPLMWYGNTIPELQIGRSEWVSRFPEWISRMTPFHFREEYHSAFSDGSWTDGGTYTNVFRKYDYGTLLSACSSNGYMWRQALNNGATTNSADSLWHDASLLYSFPAPEPLTSDYGRLYPEDGWAIASSKPANDYDTFTNGLGFILQCRPRGGDNGHVPVGSDLSAQLWAYGSSVTHAGGNPSLAGYVFQPEAADGLFVDGHGATRPGYTKYPDLPVYGWIMAYTNSSTNYTYCAADGTGFFTNAIQSEIKANVQRVMRHILMQRGKYWVFFDSFVTQTNARFGWIWHLQEVTATTNANGFTYTTTNYAGGLVTNIVFNVATDWNIHQQLGAAGSTNPITGVGYVNAYPPASVVWTTNSTPSTNFHFLTVIYPVKPGDAAPTIARLSDWTVAVTNGVDVDIISWRTNEPYASTMIIDSEGISGYVAQDNPTPPEPPDPPSSTNRVANATLINAINARGTTMR